MPSTRPPTDIPPHPDARETWFRELPPERRAALKREHAARVAHESELVSDRNRQVLRQAWPVGAVFAFGDMMCPYGSLGTPVVAFLVGGVLGLVSAHGRWGHLACAVLSIPLFLGVQLGTRGVLNMLVAFALFAVAGMTALAVQTRED